ncbi:hypothetical protein HPP92_019171 [Vanilla planifolia]|uniref:SBP-type domain-containing protein n=1 Tax=Vanilla planifolia TaxID=51239 RepID=A0A835UKH5_VANPL|nr:hypothetical protein HPP92_019171 [Vanilla planifolia]
MEKGSSSGGGSGDSPNGLKFGKKIYFESTSGCASSSKSEILTVLPEAAPSLLAVRKGKGAAQGSGQPPRCQVDGCNVDLTGAKAYYCRHKVCGMHSKSPKVIVAGVEKRFCQQCSRFHFLTEFDQGKRSCRRRLAGHNERRRKPPLASFPSRVGPISSSNEDYSRYRGIFMDYIHPNPSDSARDVWPAMGSSHRVAAGSHWTRRNFNNPGMAMSNHYPSLLSRECFTGASESTCALSLLSTQPWDEASAFCGPRSQRAPAILSDSEFGMAEPSVMCSYTISSSAYKDVAVGIGSHEMQDGGTVQFSSELELAVRGGSHCPHGVDPSHVCDHLHNVHWSL